MFYINSGSIKNKYNYLNDYISTHDYDIVAICETWLGTSDYDDTCVNGLLPPNYGIHRADRRDGRQGGGVALAYKQSLNIKCKEPVMCTQFECIICAMTLNNIHTNIIVVYRPPASQQNNLSISAFLTEWAQFLSQHTTSTAELIIVGDLNIYFDAPNQCYTREMLQILEGFGLAQHVHEATHCHGHTLDVLITRDTNRLSRTAEVKDIGICDDKGNLIKGHYSIIYHINCKKVRIKSKTVSYRNFKDINYQQFREDIHTSDTLNNVTGSVNELVDRYISGLSSLVDVHAPLITRTITQRPHAPWYSENLRAAKQLRRALERKWRKTNDDDDKARYREQCAMVAKQLYADKAEYYSVQIANCQNDSKMLHKITDSLIISHHQQRLPTDNSNEHLANTFADFFETKIDNIRNNFNSIDTTNGEAIRETTFSNLRPTTTDEVKQLIFTMNNKSCNLDPIPAWLLKDCIHELLPMITAIANLSLTSGIFPDRCRQAIIRPLLKKPNLNPEELKNYRPVSNIHFLSKIIEKLVVVRIEEHLINNALHDPFQSAYRHCHSTETAVLKLHNDIVGGLDIGLCTVLASLDLSAAFDTVNHNIFITWLNTEFQFSGTITQWFKSYLDARHHNVCINDDYSRSHTSSCGVPQGSVLGARMFTMYMRPLSAIMNKHGVSYHSYADDI